MFGTKPEFRQIKFLKYADELLPRLCKCLSQSSWVGLAALFPHICQHIPSGSKVPRATCGIGAKLEGLGSQNGAMVLKYNQS